MTCLAIAPRLLQAARRAAGWTLAVWLLAPTALTVQAATRDAEPRWEQLTPAERQVLQPLQHEWPSIDLTRKQKWRELAGQFPRLSTERQELLRSRMNAWARMSPTERSAARLRYQEARRLPEAERAARWQSYQSLPEDQRKALADKAQSRGAPGKATRPAVDDVQPKSNIVAPRSAATAAPPSTMAPGTVRATVGASTRPIDQRPAPPPHQQPGLPKIVASPEFVDSSTLLPRRGPQGAAAIHTELERTTP